jgi:hypothetical protein
VKVEMSETRRKRFPQLQDEQWLRQQIEEKSLRRIAEEIGCSYSAIQYAIGVFKITVPKRSTHHMPADYKEQCKGRGGSTTHKDWTGPKYATEEERRAADRDRVYQWNRTPEGAAYRKQYNGSNKEARSTPEAKRLKKDQHLRRMYGITIEQHDQMKAAQNGRCKLCDALFDESQLETMACVDHDHTTHRVRSLLCYGCNRALGQFCDDARLLRKAIAYLEEHSMEQAA